MPRLTAPLVLLVLLNVACSDGDLCAQAPRCDDSEAINCETACAVGPCSTGPTVQDCGKDTTCTVVPGPRNDARFYRSRAVCTFDLKACSPADAGPPVCEGERLVRGCSAYLRDIRVPCSQAGLYFAQVPACCLGGGDAGTPDGGSPDAGTGDGGIPDGGALGGDAGR
ncbi:hypothetical protein JY651_03255 [Pyxidicoccus parkwayensis]|uniref:Lipoprotein n=1 Tax=Pyxidicoccus parkwayensis TaxID=2813578 RepID=A0ABX7NYK8_9BACT|nr:hypothetical protein [Pyxidicoccus parkwaysis]QSQ24011.1 hypothetical protein JY651_03255 [Pyxidicoccus parkwaysis]